MKQNDFNPMAVVTGAASGIGLAVTKHLLSRGYRVAMVDVDEAGRRLSSDLGPDTMFQKADVSSYPQFASAISEAFKFGGERLDLIALNAGIDDRQCLYESNEMTKLDEKGIPLPINLKTMEVDLGAVFQGIWLFKYFSRKNKQIKGGQIIITSSAAGLYPMAQQPQYCAAKHAIVGLTRSCGGTFLEQYNITVNCICPAFVETNLCPPHIKAVFPKDHITPMSTVLKAFDTFIDSPTMTGQTVELSLGDMYFRRQPEWANTSQEWLGTGSKEFWDEAYKTVAPAKNGV